MRRVSCALLLIFGLAACAQQPPLKRAATIQRSTSVVVPVDIVTERVESELKKLGFEIEAAGGGIVRGERLASVEGGFANCKAIRIASKTAGESTRFRNAQAVQEQIRVVARISQLNEATNVTVEPLMVGIYNNSFTNRQTDAPCPSNGKLEKAVLAAVEQLGPAPGSKDGG